LNPTEYCQQKAAASGSSFYYSFLFLPKEKKEAITAVYAFCREVDDVVDECSDQNVARTKLAWWRREISSSFSGQPQHPVAQALAPVVKNFKLEQQNFQEIIDGMEMDLEHNRYSSFQDLQLYCHRVASVVGQLAAQIFGYQNSNTLNYAHHLGLAFQLTNIIRDVGEDAKRNRIYIPIDELRQFDVPAADILDGKQTDNFAKLMKFQIERAYNFYQQAFSELAATDRHNQRPGLVMAAIYKTLLEEIELANYQVLNQRIALTPLRKLWIAWRTWIKG
jgi:phytoene synthase